MQRLTLLYNDGAPEEIRTPDPLVRSQVLYPAELRARFNEGVIVSKCLPSGQGKTAFVRIYRLCAAPGGALRGVFQRDS